jgi:DNA-binding response OmpR family regulator
LLPSGKLAALENSEMSALRNSIEFLMVDDNPGITEFVAVFLRGKRHTCATLNDARAVVPWLDQNRCEVAIVDLHMSPLDGIGLIERIREIDSKLPIVVFTALGYEEDRMQAALRAGANGYVSKNLPAEQLYCVLARVLATARYQARPFRGRPGLAGAA